MSCAGRGRVAFAVVLALQLAALYWPRVDLARAPQDSDKLAHVLLFAVPVLVGVVAVRRWWPAYLLALHAPVSEALQTGWLPGRSGSAADALADLVGVALGSALAVLTLRRWGAPAPAHPSTASRRLPGPEV